MSNKRWQENASGFASIDRDAGVIRGVKVLGLKSKNGRRYLREAVESAVPKYEGRKIYVDHIDVKEGTTRKTRERWGKLQNVAPDSNGELFGDLHYLKSHPMTEQILEAAERFNDFGLSHDAGGKTRREKGTDVIHEIAEVYSVDVVQEPATNRNLFESTNMSKVGVLQALRENIKKPFAAQLLARMTEMEEIYDEAMTMDVAAGEEPGHEVENAFRAAIMAIVDGEHELGEKLKKIRLLLDVQQKVADDHGHDHTGDEEMSKEVTEQLEARVAELEKENAELKESKRVAEDRIACVKLLEDAKRDATEVRVKALLKLDADDRMELVESWDPRKGDASSKPASSPSKFKESQNRHESDDDIPDDVDGLKKLLAV